MSENIILLFQKSFLPYLTFLRYLAHFLPKECPKIHVINYLARPHDRLATGHRISIFQYIFKTFKNVMKMGIFFLCFFLLLTKFSMVCRTRQVFLHLSLRIVVSIQSRL